MRNRVFLLIALCMVVVLLLCSCSEKKDADATETDGALTPVTDDSGNVTGYERKYHNDNGDVTRWDVYDANEQYDHYTLYEYDDEYRLLKETCYQANGIGIYYYAYSYNDDGVIMEKDYVTMKEGSERLLYDSEGKEQYRYTYDNEDQLSKYEVYRNGKWVKEEPPTEADETTTAQ